MLTLGFFPSLFFFVFFLDPGMEPLFSPPLRSWYLLSFFFSPPSSKSTSMLAHVRACGWFKAVELEDSFNASAQDRPTDQPPAPLLHKNKPFGILSCWSLPSLRQPSFRPCSVLKKGGLSSVFLLSASCFRSVIFVTPFLLFSFYEERKLFVAAVYFFIFWYILLPPFFIAPCLLNRGQTGAWALLLSRNALLLARKTTKFTGH